MCHVTRREVSAESEGTSDSTVEEGRGHQLRPQDQIQELELCLVSQTFLC